MKRLVFLALAGIAAPVLSQDKASSLVKEKEIVLKGGPSFDCVNVDSDAGRLYVAHSPKIDVIDLKKGEKIGEVDGVDGAHAAVVVPEFKRGFASAGKKDKLVVFDIETFKVTKEIATGQSPDAILFVGATREIWTFNGKGKSVTCVDPSTLEVKATIRLDGKPEFTAEHMEKGLVYVTLEDKNALCVIDAKKHEVVTTHPVAPGEEPSGLAFDVKNGLLFVGCGNKKLVLVDTASWEVVTSVDIGEHCDGVAFDPETGNAFASCLGTTIVVHRKDGKTLESLPSLETKGGKTCTLDPKTHKLYVASGPRRGEKGTVQVLVFAPK